MPGFYTSDTAVTFAVLIWLMEFPFNINELLPDTITLVDDKLAPFRARVKNDRCVSLLILCLKERNNWRLFSYLIVVNVEGLLLCYVYVAGFKACYNK